MTNEYVGIINGSPGSRFRVVVDMKLVNCDHSSLEMDVMNLWLSVDSRTGGIRPSSKATASKTSSTVLQVFSIRGSVCGWIPLPSGKMRAIACRCKMRGQILPR